jgi:cytochrome P450
MILSVGLASAADTTVFYTDSYLFALLLNHFIQTRAHAELDAESGPPTAATSRLPTFSDRPNFPYIDASLKESLRWLTAFTLGHPHPTTQDDVCRGWMIPKGSIVIANAWAMLHDPNTCGSIYISS